jgi:hypothetical protein
MRRMRELPAKLIPFVPWALAAYALCFVAGGIYYLEQRVRHIRDQFPGRAIVARLTGYAALFIGLLAAVSVTSYLVRPGSSHYLGALVAAGAGVAFWVSRLYAEPTIVQRLRDSLFALVCLSFTGLVAWWVSTL